MLVDTHAHLYAGRFDQDREAMLQRAFDAGVEAIYLPNIDGDSIEAMLQLEAAYPRRCFAMMGLHPCSVDAGYEAALAKTKEWLDRRDFCAVGEIGIDLYWDKTFVDEQRAAFLTQVGWAVERELPVVIHSRESIDMIIELLQELSDDRLRGIFHCFTGDARQAQAAIDLGFYLGIGGVLTFKNSGLDQVLKTIDLAHLVLETDAPYLAPAPHRGKRNESAYVRLVAERLAAVQGRSMEAVARQTTRNAYAVFGKAGRFIPENVATI